MAKAEVNTEENFILPREMRLLHLYRLIHKEHNPFQKNKDEYRRILAELELVGYSVEVAWGVYLHTPDGNTLTLDGWNEEANDKA